MVPIHYSQTRQSILKNICFDLHLYYTNLKYNNSGNNKLSGFALWDEIQSKYIKPFIGYIYKTVTYINVYIYNVYLSWKTLTVFTSHSHAQSFNDIYNNIFMHAFSCITSGQ